MPLFPSDFKKFKHVKSDDKTTVLEHPKGHQITIVHKALGKDMQAQLKALSKISQEDQTSSQAQEKQADMPKMADGGIPQEDISTNTFLKTPSNSGYKSDREYETMPKIESDANTLTKAERRKAAGYTEKPTGQVQTPGPQPQNYDEGGEVQESPEQVAQDVTPDYSQGVPEDATPDAPKQSIPEQLGHAVRRHFENSPVYQSYKLGKIALPEVQKAAQDFAKGAGLTEQPQERAQQQAPAPSMNPAPQIQQDMAQNEPSGAPAQQQPEVQQAPAQAPQQPQQQDSPPQNNYVGYKQAAINQINKQYQAFQQEVANGQITPKTYSEVMFHDKGTLGKIGSIFGLMLSSAGAGLSRQPNMALQMMDNEIVRDMESQKQNIGNAQNLLRINQQGLMNEAQLKNLDAETATKAWALTKMQKNAAALHTLALQVDAMPAGSPQRQQAEQTLAMMNQSVQNDNYNLLDRAASASAYYKMVLGNGASQESPATQIRKRQLVGAISPQQSEKALEEIGKTENHVQLNKNALDSFDTVANLATVKSKAGSPIQNQRRIDAEWNPMMDKLTKDTEGRVTPITVDMMASLKPTVLDDKNTLALKRNKMNAILNGGFATPTLDSIGINVNKGERSGPTQSQDMVTGTDGKQYQRQVINGKRYLVPVK